MRNPFGFSLCLILAPFIFMTRAGAQDAPSGIRSTIQNSLTVHHVHIPGTRLYIVPPEGFRLATNFTGLQKNNNTALNVFDMPGGDYYTNAADFGPAAFQAKGAKVLDYRELRVNGYPAKFMQVQGDPGVKSDFLVFGDSTFSAMIMAIHPSGQEADARQLIAALNSIVYDKHVKIDPFETAFFTLDVSQARFKFFQYAATVYMYTVGGKDNGNDANAPTVMVSQLPADEGMNAKSAAAAFVAKMGEKGLNLKLEKEKTDEKVDGCDTYQAWYKGDKDGAPVSIYICSLQKKDKIVALIGIGKKEPEKIVLEFEQLAHGIKMK